MYRGAVRPWYYHPLALTSISLFVGLFVLSLSIGAGLTCIEYVRAHRKATDEYLNAQKYFARYCVNAEEVLEYRIEEDCQERRNTLSTPPAEKALYAVLVGFSFCGDRCRHTLDGLSSSLYKLAFSIIVIGIFLVWLLGDRLHHLRASADRERYSLVDTMPSLSHAHKQKGA